MKGFLSSLYEASVSEPAGGADIHNRVAMVSYSNNAYYVYPNGSRDGLFSDTQGDKNSYTLVTNASTLAKGAFRDVVSNFTSKDEFVNWAEQIRVGGRTTTNLGIQAAQLAFENAPETSEDRAKVMILFTDGAPGSGYRNYGPDSNDSTLARPDWVTPSIQTAQKMKDDGVTIYSVGLFPSANGYGAKSISYDIQRDGQGSDGFFQNANCFLHLVSSNYPDAAGVDERGSLSDAYQEDKRSYYVGTDDANELSQIFQQLSEELKPGSTQVNLAENAVVKDVITKDFQITDGAKVTAWTESYQGVIDGKMTWTKDMDSVSHISDAGKENKLHMQVDGRTVTVTNFDFADNYVHMDGNLPQGKKLVLEIEIKPADGILGGVKLPTNTDKSAIYENSSTSTPVDKFPLPHVDLPTTVTIKKVVIGDDNEETFSFAADYSGTGTYDNISAQKTGESNYLQLITQNHHEGFNLENNGTKMLENVAVGSTLVIQETSAEGYTAIVTTGEGSDALEPDQDGKYRIPVTTGMVVTFTNIKYTIQLTKVDKEDKEKKLDGAVFELKKWDEEKNTWTPVENGKQQTADNGTAEWTGLEAGKYQLSEITAPAGYITSNSVTTITLPKEDPDHDGIVKVEFTNGKAPQTGGSGTLLYTAAGLTLLVCAAGVYIVSRKKFRG